MMLVQPEAKTEWLPEHGRLDGARWGVDERAAGALDYLCSREEFPRWWHVHDRLRGLLGTGMLVALVGNYGTGKTVIGASMVGMDAATGGRPLYKRAQSIFDRIRRTFGDEAEETAEGVKRDLLGRSLLVIDEAHERGHTDFENTTLNELVKIRQGRFRDTVLISNEEPRVFADSVGHATIDRMAQSGGVYECKWPSFRRAGKETR